MRTIRCGSEGGMLCDGDLFGFSSGEVFRLLLDLFPICFPIFDHRVAHCTPRGGRGVSSGVALGEVPGGVWANSGWCCFVGLFCLCCRVFRGG